MHGCTKFDFGCGCVLDPARGAHGAPTDLLVRSGREVEWRKGKGRERAREGRPLIDIFGYATGEYCQWSTYIAALPRLPFVVGRNECTRMPSDSCSAAVAGSIPGRGKPGDHRGRWGTPTMRRGHTVPLFPPPPARILVT